MPTTVQNKVIPFKQESYTPAEYQDNNYNYYAPQPMLLPDTYEPQHTPKKSSVNGWQKAGTIGTVLLGAGVMGTLLLSLFTMKKSNAMNEKSIKMAEEQLELQKKQLKKMLDEKEGIDKLLSKFKDLSKDIGIPNIEAESINPKVRKFIKETIESLKVDKDICKYTGSDMPPRMLLLHGPTGTGKTFSAKIFAKAQGAEYAEVQFSDVSSKYVGETSVKISQYFEEFGKVAKENPDKNYVATFNEIDSLISNLEGAGEGKDHLMQNRTSFLNGLDSIKDIPNLTIIGTTNVNPHKAGLDKATLGRFGNIFEIPLPNKKELHASLKMHLEKSEAVNKYNFMKENEKEIDKFLDELVALKGAHRDVEKLVEQALNKFKISIKDMPKSEALKQKFNIKYLKEALAEKEVMPGNIGENTLNNANGLFTNLVNNQTKDSWFTRAKNKTVEFAAKIKNRFTKSTKEK